MRAAANIDNEPPPAYKIKLEEISQYVRKVTLSATCRLAIISTTNIAHVKYPICQVEMRLFTTLSQLSRRIVFCFTRTKAVQGDYLFNLLHLQH